MGALALLSAVLIGGTAGYVLIEGWGVFDAVYMTVTTISTVGFREVHPLSRGGQAFTMLLVVGGVGSALYAFSAVTAVVVEGGWRPYVAEWRRTRMLEQLSGHYVLCGYGRIGRIIADEFQRQRIPFVIIERDPALVAAASERGCLAIEADASSEDALRRVHIDRARGLVAAVGTDAENVYTVLTGRVLNSRLFIIARAESEDSSAKLRRAGADRVISPYRIGAVQMAQTALRPAVVDFVEIATSSDNLDLSMEQVKIEPGSALGGRSLTEANLRQRFGVVVVGIQRAGGRMEFNPPPEALMQPGDHLVVLGSAGHLKSLERAAAAAETPA